MALWRIFEPNVDLSVGWAVGHPLLIGVLSTGNSQAAKKELEALQKMLLEDGEGLLARQAQDPTQTTEAPEALALISFGLLLCLA
jgi:hypothetical protein